MFKNSKNLETKKRIDLITNNKGKQTMKKDKLIKLIKNNTEKLIRTDQNEYLTDQINSVKSHIIDKINELDLYENQLEEYIEKEKLSYFCVQEDYFKTYYYDGSKFINNKLFAMVDLIDDLDSTDSFDSMITKDKHGIRNNFNSVEFSNRFCDVVGSHILEYK